MKSYKYYKNLVSKNEGGDYWVVGVITQDIAVNFSEDNTGAPLHEHWFTACSVMIEKLKMITNFENTFETSFIVLCIFPHRFIIPNFTPIVAKFDSRTFDIAIATFQTSFPIQTQFNSLIAISIIWTVDSTN